MPENSNPVYAHEGRYAQAVGATSAPDHPVYECARQVLQRVLSRLELDSQRRASASDRANDNLTQHRQAGHAIGLASAAEILREEMDRLPK